MRAELPRFYDGRPLPGEQDIEETRAYSSDETDPKRLKEIEQKHHDFIISKGYRIVSTETVVNEEGRTKWSYVIK